MAVYDGKQIHYAAFVKQNQIITDGHCQVGDFVVIYPSEKAMLVELVEALPSLDFFLKDGFNFFEYKSR